MNNSSYFGGKAGSGTYQNIINQIPKCDIYCEPFLGGAGIVRNLSLPTKVFLNDLDSGLIDNFNFTAVQSEVSLSSVDYRVIVSAVDSISTVVYFDPPYLFSTRKSKRPIYKFEFSDKDHIDFLSYVRSLKSKVLISHYQNHLYDQALSDWRYIDFQSMTRSGLAWERLYMNYCEPTILQDYRYIGENFTDRQRIKRQNARLLAKINSLPHHQKTSLLLDLSMSQVIDI